ncbi:MAG: hypothetical protein ACOYM9_11115 [Bradymonadia bacterium]
MPPRLSKLTSSAVVALALAVPVSVGAQPAAPAVAAPASAPEDPAALMVRAQAAIDAASGKFRAGDFDGALGPLREAEALASAANDPALATVRFNIARCLEELDRPAEAVAAFERYLELPDETHRKERAWVAIRALEPRAFGTLQVSCRPAGVRLVANALEASPVLCPWQRARVAPGRYTIEAQAPGYAPTTREVEVKLGPPTFVDLELLAFPTERVVAAEQAAPAVEAGRGPWPWILAGAGVAALAGGALLTTSAVEARDAAETLPPGSARNSKVDTYELDERLSWGAYGLGAGALSAGLLWLFLPASTEAP